MRDKRDSLWVRWDINKFCSINNNTNTNMFISELRISENYDTTIPNVNNRNRIFINRGIHSDGCVRVLCII